FHFTLIAFDFLLVDLLLMLLDLAKTVLDRANKMFAFRHYDCRSLAHAPRAPLPRQQRDAAATTARVTRSRSKSFKSLDSRSGAKNATSSARSLMLAKAAMSSSAVMTPPSRRVRRGVAQPMPQVRKSTSRQSVDLGELAWAPVQRSVGRTKLMWERPSVRIAALHARHLWACWFASDRPALVRRRSLIFHTKSQKSTNIDIGLLFAKNSLVYFSHLFLREAKLGF